jgi:hypothetical protein
MGTREEILQAFEDCESCQLGEITRTANDGVKGIGRATLHLC